MERASSAAAKLTIDSSASESRPTDPVRRQASALSAIVATAAAIDSQAKRSRLVEAVNIGAGLLFRELGQDNPFARGGGEAPRPQNAAQPRGVHGDRLRRRMRVGATRLDLLAGPALEEHQLPEAALRPWRLILVALEIDCRLQHRRRIELVGREVRSSANPAPRRAKSRNRQALREVLLVVPGVELLLHRRRRFGEREEQTSVHALLMTPFSRR